MRKVIRRNTTIMDSDNIRIFKVRSVGDGVDAYTYCSEYDFSGNLVCSDVKLYNREIVRIVYNNYNARAVFRPEEDEDIYYKIYIKDDEFTYKHGSNLPELVEYLSNALIFSLCNTYAMIEVRQFTEECEWVTTYKTPWLSKDYVQEIDDFYSYPPHECYTLEECMEELKETTSWV